MYFFIILFGLTMLYVSTTNRVESYIKTLSMQGLLLFCMVALDMGKIERASFAFLVVETLIFKTILIPYFLVTVIRKNGIFRDVETHISQFYSLIISSFIFSFGFVISYWLMKNYQDIRPLYFGISISTVMTGLFIIVSRKKLITHVMGYMMLENGIFLLSLSVAKEMPLVVNLGVLLDIFAVVFLLGLFITKIKSTFKEAYTDKLTNLKD